MYVVGRLLTVDAGKFLTAVAVNDKKTFDPAVVKSDTDAPPLIKISYIEIILQFSF
jgi:hypothetical protein